MGVFCARKTATGGRARSSQWNSWRRLIDAGALALATLLALTPATAQETENYTYDGRGRLVTVTHSGTANDGVSSCYAYDEADNRTASAIATAAACDTGSGGTTTLTLSPTSLPGGTVGSAYSKSITASGGTGPYTFARSSGTLPAGLTLTSGGVLSGTPTTASTYNFSVTATDSASNTGTRAYSVAIASSGGTSTLTLSPTTLPGGTVGTRYVQTITASGGSGSGYQYSLTSGSLPPGLALRTLSGRVVGTPTASGSYSFRVTATDSASNSGSRAYTIAISGGSSTITLSPTSLPGGTVGSVYSQTISASGGSSPYTFAKSSGTLPAGLTLNSTGVLSGTPTTAATYSFTVQATDSASNSGSRAYSVTIGASSSTCSGVTFAVNDTSATEGDPLVFTISKAGSTAISCSVSYATADGTATAGTAYTAASGTLTFTSAQTSKTVSVTTFNLSSKFDKTVLLNLSAPSGGSALSDGQGVGTIYGSSIPTGGCDPICPLVAVPDEFK